MISSVLNRSRQRGAAAVELALLLPIFVFIMSFPLFLGRYFWHYTAVQKATQDAARYLSTISEQEMRDPVLAESAAALAASIVQMEISELDSGGQRPRIAVLCGEDPCQGVTSSSLPETVTVGIRMDMVDHIFGLDSGRYGLRLNVRYEVRYVGK